MRLAVAAALLVLPLGVTAQSSPDGRRATAYGWRRMAPTTAAPSDVAAALSLAAEVSRGGAETDLAVALDAADGWRLDNGSVEVDLRYGGRPLEAPEPAQASGEASDEDSQATDDGTVVMLYLPESINGARILTETDEAGRFLVDMSVVHGGPGAQVGFRNTRRMADRNPEFVADDGSVLKGTLRDGWLEVEFQVRRSRDCLEEYAEGRSQGFSEGHRSGFMDGHKQGSEQGIAYGQHKGYAEGLETGQRQKCKFADRHESWYLTGYLHGYNRLEYDSPHDIDSETVPLTAEEDMCSAEEVVCSVTDGGHAVIEERGEPGQGGVRELSPGTSGETRNRTTLYPEQIPDDQAQHESLRPEDFSDDIVGWFVLLLFGWHLLGALAGCRWLLSLCWCDGADCVDADADELLLDDEEDDAIFSSSGAAPADQWEGREPEAESSLLEAESLDESDGPTRTDVKAESGPILGPSTSSPPDLSSTMSGAPFQHFDMCTPRNGPPKTPRDNYSARRSVGAGLHASSSPVVGWEDWENSFVTSDNESSCDGETESEVCEVALGDSPCQEAGCTIDVTGGDVAACRGSYVRCGACNGRPLFTSASGAVIFFDACWKMSGPSCPGDCWFEAQGQGRLPPAGHWSPLHGVQSSPVVAVRGSQAKEEAAPPCGSSGLPGCMPPRVAPPTVDVTRFVAHDDGKLCIELSNGERWVFDQLPGKGTAGDPKSVL